MSDAAPDAAGSGIEVRQARPSDEDAVVAFTEDTWSDRDAGDYLPGVFGEWVRSDGDDQRTVVATVDGEVAGVGQGVLLSDTEAWAQGLRVDPEHRGRGVSAAVTRDVFDWARERGATVIRAMVFSWNVAGLGQARAMGYDPATEFRWIHPDPDPRGLSVEFDGVEGSTTDTESLAVTEDPDVANRFWADSAAREGLRGLALSLDESWALSELAPGILRQAAEVGADRTRVLVPEDPRPVSDAARLRVELSDEPDFVLAADLTGRSD